MTVQSLPNEEFNMIHSLEGWAVGHHDDHDWTPWGATTGTARAKVLAVADDYYVTLIEADAGYAGDAHEHAYPEFLYVVDGRLRTQGVELGKGDAYAAASGSVHTDFATETGATYLLVFRL
jgi:quercetin dioxygenase-like cupin family protein